MVDGFRRPPPFIREGAPPSAIFFFTDDTAYPPAYPPASITPPLPFPAAHPAPPPSPPPPPLGHLPSSR